MGRTRISLAVCAVFALALAGCGVVGTLVDAYDVPQVFAWLMLFVGLGWAGWALLRLHERRAVLVLSPSGILLRGLRDILIPWPEICGVDSVRIDATEPVTHRPAGVTFDNVTVVLVSKSF